MVDAWIDLRRKVPSERNDMSLRILPLNLVRRILPWGSLVGVLVFYSWLQVINFTPGYLEVDPDGYLTLAKRMADGGPMAVKDDDPFVHQTHVWVENSRGEVTPKFNLGYPALMAIAYRLGGDTAMFWVSPVFGGLALIGAFLLFRLWMSPSLSLFALATLATNGTFLFYSGYLLTHTADLCLTVWGIYFLLEYTRRPGTRWAVGAGLCLGFAATIRHTSILLAIPLMIAVVSKLVAPKACAAVPCDATPVDGDEASPAPKSESPARKGLLPAAALLLMTYAIFPALLAAYNWRVFGSPLTTGYALSGEQGAFAWGFFRRDFQLVINGLNRDGFFLIFPIGLVGMILASPWLKRAILCTWFLPLYFVYGSYYWKTGNLSYFRFFINVIPLLAGMTFMLIEQARTSRAAKLAGAVALAGLIFMGNLPFLRTAFRGQMNTGCREMAAAARAIQAQPELQKDAVIFSRQPFHAYVGTLAGFRFYDLRAFTDIRNDFQPPPRVDFSRYYEEAPRRQSKRTGRFHEFYRTHHGNQLRRMKIDMIHFWLRQGRQVVFFLPDPELQAQQDDLSSEFCFRSLGRVMVFRTPWSFGQVIPDATFMESPR